VHEVLRGFLVPQTKGVSRYDPLARDAQPREDGTG